MANVFLLPITGLSTFKMPLFCRSLINRKNVWPRQGRQGEGKSQVALQQGRPPVPCGPHPQAPQVRCFVSLLLLILVLLGRGTMRRGFELAHPSTWQQWWNTLPPRSWSSLATLPGITRNLGLSPGTCSWPLGNVMQMYVSKVSSFGSETMRSWTSSWLESPSPRVESCPTSRQSSFPRKAKELEALVPRRKLELVSTVRI